MQSPEKKAELIYQILCDDVRLEIGNKLSFMGVFQDIFAQEIPFSLPRLAVCNHWRGNGQFLSEVRVLFPDRQRVLAASAPSPIQIPPDGYANNVTFFLNVTFSEPGEYVFQTLIDSSLFSETVVRVGVVQFDDGAGRPAEDGGNDVLH
jgi:hypothetical protein